MRCSNKIPEEGSGSKTPEYVLFTAARDEEQFIETTLKSVLGQTVLPREWVIVDDNSRDRTGAIISAYARRYPLIRHISLRDQTERDFSSKVYAIRRAIDEISQTEYAFVGNLDADIRLDSDYYRTVLSSFGQDEHLGVAGGLILELVNGKFVSQINHENSVAGAVQMFRRKCFEEIGPFLPLRYGGEDAAAETAARMHGWKVKTFSQLAVYHLRPVGSGAGSMMRLRYRHGIRDYMLGYHPAFEFVSAVYRVSERPAVLGSAMRILGYLLSCATFRKRPVDDAFMRFLRKEQMERLSAFLCRKKDRDPAKG